MLGICNEVIKRGASISEGLGDCPEFRSAPGILDIDTGGKREPVADGEAVEEGLEDARRDTTLANSSARLVVRASTVSCEEGCDGAVVATLVPASEDASAPAWSWKTKAANGLVPVLESDGVVLELDCCS